MKNLKIDQERIEAFCAKWRIRELSLFGSVLRDDFGPDSDVDVVVSFRDDEQWSLWDHLHMNEELAEIMGRKVDLFTRRGIEDSPNWLRRKSIMESLETLYVQG